MKTLYSQYDSLFGTIVPGIVVYMPDYRSGFDQLTQIRVPVLESIPRDYAKDALDRIRYLHETYTHPYGPSSTLPSDEAFRDAEAFIMNLPLNRTGMPSINVASDGEVNFSWSEGERRIDLGFFGNGTYSYYAQSGDEESIGDGITARAELPADLLKIATAR